jgi:hypothetical protein
MTNIVIVCGRTAATRTAVVTLLVGAFGVAANQSASAGPLYAHAAALDDWTGREPFGDGLGVGGYVEYAVFTAASFVASFPGSGYVPGDEFVYAYQIDRFPTNGFEPENNVDAALLALDGPANAIGTFEVGDVAPVEAGFVGTDAQWVFKPGLGPDQSSWALVLSSSSLPVYGFMEIQTSLYAMYGYPFIMVGYMPVPGSAQAPEPAALALLGLGLAGLAAARRRSQAAAAAARSIGAPLH